VDFHRALPIVVDILTFSSLALLAVPAFHVNRYARRAARLSRLRFQPGFSRLNEVYRKALKALEDARDGWKPWKAQLLLWGTIAGALAAIASLVDHLWSYFTAAPAAV
jgi:hypothetical protein